MQNSHFRVAARSFFSSNRGEACTASTWRGGRSRGRHSWPPRRYTGPEHTREKKREREKRVHTKGPSQWTCKREVRHTAVGGAGPSGVPCRRRPKPSTERRSTFMGKRSGTQCKRGAVQEGTQNTHTSLGQTIGENAQKGEAGGGGHLKRAWRIRPDPRVCASESEGFLRESPTVFV